MAKVQTILNLEIPAGKAQPAPPLGPMLGANGVNIGQFIKEFNDKTMEYMQKFGGIEVKVKAKLTIYVDRTFLLEIGDPVTSGLIKWKLKVQTGSGEPNKKKI
jgi:large subunit ribosomal protein L11